MQARDQISPGLHWLRQRGLDERELRSLNPCVPGEFTMPRTLYVNSGTPAVIYHGTEEGTLPMVAGRWYLIPAEIAETHPDLARETASVARAVRLASPG